MFATFTGVTPIRDIPGEPSPLNPSTSLIIHKAVVLDCIGCKKANGLGGLVTPDPAAAAAAPAPAAAPGAAPVVALPQIFVKLGVDAPAAERLVFASKYGSISLFSEDQSVIEANTKVIDRSNVYQTTPRQVPAPQAVTDDSDAATNTAGATPAATPTSDAAATTVPASPTIAPASAAPVVKPVAAGLNAPAATVPSVGVTPAGK